MINAMCLGENWLVRSSNNTTDRRKWTVVRGYIRDLEEPAMLAYGHGEKKSIFYS